MSVPRMSTISILTPQHRPSHTTITVHAYIHTYTYIYMHKHMKYILLYKRIKRRLHMSVPRMPTISILTPQHRPSPSSITTCILLLQIPINTLPDATIGTSPGSTQSMDFLLFRSRYLCIIMAVVHRHRVVHELSPADRLRAHSEVFSCEVTAGGHRDMHVVLIVGELAEEAFWSALGGEMFWVFMSVFFF
jgi:hypothetical protein